MPDSRLVKSLGVLRGAFSQLLFTLALWFLAGVLGWMLFMELLKKDHDPALLATLVLLLLLVILFNQYESVFIGRLKKIGPLELFEEARNTLAIEELGKLVPSSEPHKLHAFQCQQGDIAVCLLEFTKSQPEKTKDRDKYLDLLSKVGSWAFVQKDWARATARLERLRELSADSFSPEVVLPVLGLAYFYWAGEEKGVAARQHFEKAVETFSKLIKLGKANHLTYFHLAYAQDELGFYYEATESNKEALKRRPRFAPAKYNLAVSYVKLGKLESAYEALIQIGPEDESRETTLRSATVDEEIAPLREHPEWKDKVARLLGLTRGEG